MRRATETLAQAHDLIVFIIIVTAFPTQSLFHGAINKDFISPQVFAFVIRTCLQFISNDLSSHIHGFASVFPCLRIDLRLFLLVY